MTRRAANDGVRLFTLVLGAFGGLLAIASILLLVARAGAHRRVVEARTEAVRTEATSRELELHNAELEQARDRAERALTLAEETNRIRSEFVLMINHELRTPLASVVTGASLLLEQVVVDIALDAFRLQSMIAEMLNVARIENRGLGYTLRDVALREVVDRIEGPGFDRLLDEGTRVGCHADVAHVVLRTDPDPLFYWLSSLCNNAFTHGATRVGIEVTRDVPEELRHGLTTQMGEIPSEAVVFLVSDDGPEIDPEFLPRMFDKFEKRAWTSGIGLGLYVGRLMIEALEGAIVVSTCPNGTTMAVAIAAAQLTTEAGDR